MTFLLFDSASGLSFPELLAMLVVGLGLGTAALAGLHRSLNPQASPDLALGPAPARFWGLLGASALGMFLWKCPSLLRIGQLFGVRYWPVRYSAGGYARYALTLSSWGALSFWIASERGLAGRMDRWLPPLLPKAWAKQWLAGALVGLGIAWAGIYSHRWLFIGNALGRAGFNALGPVLTVIPLLLFPVASLFWLWLLQPLWEPAPVSGAEPWEQQGIHSADLSARARMAMIIAFLLLWSLPSHWAEAYLRAYWDYGHPDLAAASGTDLSSPTRKIAVIVLSDKRGFPGWQRRDAQVEVSGIDASPRNLEALRRYMDSRSWRSLFAVQALEVLRKGWALNWEPENYMDAAIFGLGNRSPSDFLGFLDAVRAAPATLENYQRLERAAAFASKFHFIRVDLTQKLYEGFSAAYAHFGETKESNAWLEKIQGLWPLYSENIHVAPVAQDLSGRITGSLSVNGRPATEYKVGLFVVQSTADYKLRYEHVGKQESIPIDMLIDAKEGLVDSTYPDWRGRFEFAHLVPGRYYLAVQAGAERMARDLVPRNAPGVVRLEAEQGALHLAPIAFVQTGVASLRQRRRAPGRGKVAHARKRRRRA